VTKCNPYGWENPGGPNPAGGLLADDHRVDESKRFHCGADAVHRYKWICSHENLPPGAEYVNDRGPDRGRIRISRLNDGHRSAEPFGLCEFHAQLLGHRVGRQLVPCPRCVAIGPDHKCWLRLEMVS
jgi:hypothetical protein